MKTRSARKPGRPARYIVDGNGDTVVGLHIDKTRGTHFTRHDGKKVYFGVDRDVAIMRFRSWQAEQGGDRKIMLTDTRGFLGEGVDVEDAIAEGWVKPEDRDKTLPWPTFVDADSLWREVRRVLLEDPRLAAERTGIPELARLATLPQPDRTLTLSRVWELYTSRKKQPSQHWLRKMKSYWQQFIDIVGVDLVADVTQPMVNTYHDKIWSIAERDERSAVWVNHRLQAVRSVLATAIKKREGVDEIRRVLGLTDVFEFGQKADPDPRPISRDDLHKVLAVAPLKWKVAIVLALNACLYPSEIADVKKSDLDLDKGTFVSRRAKTRVRRVAMLWPRTVELIRQLLRNAPHGRKELLLNQNGAPYNANHIGRNWRNLIAKAGLQDIEFASIRDGGYSAACEGATLDEVRVLAGHSAQISDHYLKRAPQLVNKACQSIERHYFSQG